MAGAAIKGLGKALLKRRETLGGAKAALKKKPIPRYRTDPRTGERFLNKRAT